MPGGPGGPATGRDARGHSPEELCSQPSSVVDIEAVATGHVVDVTWGDVDPQREGSTYSIYRRAAASDEWELLRTVELAVDEPRRLQDPHADPTASYAVTDADECGESEICDEGTQLCAAVRVTVAPRASGSD